MNQGKINRRRLIFPLLAGAGLILLFALPAWGSVSHDQHKAVSPFESKEGDTNPHCFLNRHNHGNVPCPHSLFKVPKENAAFYIGVECGGNPQGSLPIKTSFDNSSALSNSGLFLPPEMEKREKPQDFSLRKFHLSYLLDHPPKSV